MVLNSLGFPALAPPSESCIINKKYLDKLSLRYDNILILMDKDETGREVSSKYLKLYPTELYNTRIVSIPSRISYKDIADIMLKYKKVKTFKVLKRMIKNSVSSRTYKLPF